MGFISGLVGKGLSFFGGGLAGKIALIGIVASAAAIGLLSWQLSGTKTDLKEANENIGVWKQAAKAAKGEIAKRDVALGNWAVKWDEEKQRQKQQADIMLKREQENERLSASLNALQNDIKVLSYENAKVSEYLSVPIPGALLERLRSAYGYTGAGSTPSGSDN